jgi:hypothetical protein
VIDGRADYPSSAVKPSRRLVPSAALDEHGDLA